MVGSPSDGMIGPSPPLLWCANANAPSAISSQWSDVLGVDLALLGSPQKAGAPSLRPTDGLFAARPLSVQDTPSYLGFQTVGRLKLLSPRLAAAR